MNKLKIKVINPPQIEHQKELMQLIKEHIQENYY